MAADVGLIDNTMGGQNLKEIEEETMHFHKVVSCFKGYKSYALKRAHKSLEFLKTLPAHHQKLLQGYGQHLNNLQNCIEHNGEVLKILIKDADSMFENSRPAQSFSAEVQPSPGDMDRIQATLKQIVRDWSAEGAQERKECYDPIIAELEERFPDEEGNGRLRMNTRVLVPGAGLGRLAHEIAQRGFACQGNEFSLFMLFASNFVLNRCKDINSYKIYPWVHQHDNNLNSEDQIQFVRFPDICTSSLPDHAEFSMVAGDFLEVYQEKESWNCVATCFFIDCANNIVQFIETIYNILQPGGYWINLGPLLYHYDGVAGESSIEPSFEEVRKAIKGMGFVFEKEDCNVKTTYAQNPRSMLGFEYKSVFFVCRKPQSHNQS